MTNYTLAEAVAARALLIKEVAQELSIAADDIEAPQFKDLINPKDLGDLSVWLLSPEGRATRKFAEMLVDRMLTNPELVLERKADQKPPTGPQPHWRGGDIFATLPDVAGEHRER